MPSNLSSMLGAGPGGLASPLAADPMAFRKLPGMKATTPDEALKVGRQFESMFVSEMLNPMFAGVKSDKVFGGGHGEEMFRSLQVDEYAKGLTAQGGIGIASAVQREILRIQEQAHAPAPAPAAS
ncbi:MAG TPA: rod-binding protein [Alphaproteobacteria bacterium]